jgi:hypothetical protein
MIMSDRLEITDLFARLARVLDDKDHEGIRAVYTKDVEARSPRGELHGIDEVVSLLRESAVDGESTQHLHSDVLVDVDGDQARASAYQLVYFYRDGEAPHRTSGLRLTYQAVRQPAGWRFRDAEVKLLWQRRSAE